MTEATERPSRRVFVVAYAVWVLGITSFFVPAATWSPASRLALTRAIVEDHTLSIDGSAASTGDRARASGHWYTDKAPLPSLFAVPAYAVQSVWNGLHGAVPSFRALGTEARPAERVTVNATYQRALYVASVTTSGLSGAVLAVALFELLRRRASPLVALAASELVVLGTPILPYATSFYGHAIAGACLVLAVTLLDPRGVSGEPGAAAVRAAGACLAIAPGSEYLTAVPALGIAVWFLAHRAVDRRRRAALDLLLGAAVPALMVAAYHTACFGSPFRTGYSFLVRPIFVEGHRAGLLGVRFPTWEALFGLLFGSRRGLFYIAPIALLGSMGLGVSAFRDRDPAARIGLFSFLAMLLLNASYYMWWGGTAAGPRHLVPALGFLALGVARLLRSRRMRPLVIAAGAVSLANVLVLTLVGLEAPELGDILRDYAWPKFLHGGIARLSGASSVGLKLGLHSFLSLAPLLLWSGVGQTYVLRLLREAEGAAREAGQEA
jgi:hypothetical protein